MVFLGRYCLVKYQTSSDIALAFKEQVPRTSDAKQRLVDFFPHKIKVWNDVVREGGKAREKGGGFGGGVVITPPYIGL